MDVRAFRPVAQRRTRCQHEVFCDYKDISAVESPLAVPPLVVFG